jgi:hypothetical protein
LGGFYYLHASSLWLPEIVENAINGHPEALNVKWKFKCKLYSPDSLFYKDLEIVEMRVSVMGLSG